MAGRPGKLAKRIVRESKSTSPIHNVGSRQQEVGRFVADITHGKKMLGLIPPADPLGRLPEVLDWLAKPMANTAAAGQRFKNAG